MVNNIEKRLYVVSVVRVRVRDDNTSFALSLSYRNETKHYKIDKHVLPNKDVKLAIEDGPQFDCLMDVSYSKGSRFSTLSSMLNQMLWL